MNIHCDTAAAQTCRLWQSSGSSQLPPLECNVHSTGFSVVLLEHFTCNIAARTTQSLVLKTYTPDNQLIKF